MARNLEITCLFDAKFLTLAEKLSRDITFNDITIGNKEETVISMMRIVALRN